MKLTSLPRKIKKGLPYLGKELRSMVSDHTPLFISVPRTVHIWRSAPCNAKCIMCNYGYEKGAALREISQIVFSDDLFPRTLNEIAELCGRGTLVSYMGGEPTISKNIMEWVEQAGSLGLDFRFTTNGYLVTEEMAQRFVAAGIFNVGVSLESLDPVINEKIRPYKDGTLKTVRAIDLLLAEREKQKKYTSVNIKTVLTDLNLESFVEIVKRYGKRDGVMCTPQAFELMQGLPTETSELLYIKDIKRLERVIDQIRELKRDGYTVHVTEQGLNEILALYRKDISQASTMHGKKEEMDPSEPECNIGTDNMWIQNGNVCLCPYHVPIGVMGKDETTLSQMWHGEMAKRVRKQTRACRRLCNISCLRRTPLTHKVSTFLNIA